jgi:hypothetical protein
VCFWCGKKCECRKDGFEPTLINLDPVGWVCKQCHVRECPPHKFFVHKLLGPSLNGETNMTHLITKFAYPVCTEPFRSHCFKCDPQMQPGHRCRVCKRMATGGRPIWEFIVLPSIPVRPAIPIDPSLNLATQAPYRVPPTAVVVDNSANHRGWTNDGGWDWQLGRWNAGTSWARFGGGGWAPGGGGWASGGGGWANGWDWRH